MATGSGALKQNLRFSSAPKIALFVPDVYYVGVECRRTHPVLTGGSFQRL